MSHESFNQPENNSEEFSISREMVIDALKAKGKEDPATMEMLGTWIEQGRMEVEKVKGKEAHYWVSVECSIETAKVFMESGFLREAYDDLLDTQIIAQNTRNEEQYNRINRLLDDLERMDPSLM